MRRFAIPNLMQYIAATMVVFLVFDTVQRGFSVQGFTALVPSLILQGQIWRLFTFIFSPPTSASLFAFLIIYFYFYLGKTLENVWGTTRFNMYYLFGIIGAIIAAFITGYGTNSYINMSLFLAYATLFPDQQVLLFFIIPIKMKYLAYLEGVLYIVTILFSSTPLKVAAIASLLNYFLFFGPGVVKKIKDHYRYRESRNQFKKFNNNNGGNNPWR